MEVAFYELQFRSWYLFHKKAFKQKISIVDFFNKKEYSKR